MTPGKFDEQVFISRGTKFEHTLTFLDEASGSAVDLTGLSPFSCTISNPKTKVLLLTLTVTNTDLANGQITITASEAQTANLSIQPVLFGVRDNEGNPYILDTLQVKFFPL